MPGTAVKNCRRSVARPWCSTTQSTVQRKASSCRPAEPVAQRQQAHATTATEAPLAPRVLRASGAAVVVALIARRRGDAAAAAAATTLAAAHAGYLTYAASTTAGSGQAACAARNATNATWRLCGPREPVPADDPQRNARQPVHGDRDDAEDNGRDAGFAHYGVA